MAKILLAEDDDLLRLVTRTILETDGHSVLAYPNGQQALDAFEEITPDLIVSDLTMPILDGFGLLDGIRQHPAGAAVPFLFLTARSEKDDLMQARRLGADDYLLKPYEADDLLSAVRQRLDRRKAVELFDTHQAHLQSIILLANVIETRDVYTRGHVERVQQYAMELAVALNWSAEQLAILEYGALLHDIGKVAVPESILNKPGPLNDEERDIMRAHTTAGVKVVDGVTHLHGAIPYIRSHHEKWDGTGYPDRLAGNDIPIEGRVLAFADVYDALTTVRPYHKPMTDEEALTSILKWSGTHFDPGMSAVFAATRREKISQAQSEKR
jgi:putative two-component system response regulator